MYLLKLLGRKQLGHVLHSSLTLLFSIDKVPYDYVAATQEKTCSGLMKQVLKFEQCFGC